MESSPRPDTDPDEHVDGIEAKVDDYDMRQVADYLARPQTRLAAVLLLFVATRLWWLLAYGLLMPGPAGLFAKWAQQGIDRGQVVYRDFDCEYPPVAWWLMTVPRLIDSHTYSEWKVSAETAQQFQNWYYGWFHFELLLIDIVCWGLMLAIGGRISATARWVLPAAYTLITIAQPRLLYDSLDIGLLMFFLLFVDCWLTSTSSLRVGASGSKTVEPRSLEGPSVANGWAVSNRWGLASYLFLGLGISYKIMPVVFVPFLLLADWWAVGSVRRLAGRVLLLMIGAVGPFLIQMSSAGWSVLRLFKYHSERGIHMESIWGSMMLVAAALGVPCEVVQSHGSYDLSGGWSSALRIASSVAMLAMLIFMGVWALLRARRFDRTSTSSVESRLALDTAILVLLNSTVLSHVYSPQYAIWLLPLALLLAMNIFPPNWVVWCGFAVPAVAILGISNWLFPGHYAEFAALEGLPVAFSVTRSACLVALALLLSVCFFKKYGLNPWRAGKEAPTALAVAT
jgi:hypothetical protein